MAENKLCSQSSREAVCIEANRVLDSCRDRDCYEDVKVYLTDFGQEVIEHTGNVRVKCAKIADTCITVDSVQFNRGFYAVNIRFFINLRFEACVCGRNQEFEGVTAIDKKVVLFGGESNTSVFKSYASGTCCNNDDTTHENNGPTSSVEVASPVILGAKIVEEREYSCCSCCCCCDEIPERVYHDIGAPLSNSTGNRILVVSIGIFSVVRLTRPAQYLVNATEYSVPDKECVCDEEKDPCCLFRSMAFPTEEFSTPYLPTLRGNDKHCGCRDNY